MSNTKTTKRALLTSVLALMLCFAMLTGTTFAWFTDTETSSGNKIVAGNLDVELLLWDGVSTTDYTNISDESKAIFTAEGTNLVANDSLNTIWEPGKTQVAYLAIKNNGNLDLKYMVNLDTRNPADGKDLYKVMQYTIIPDAQFGKMADGKEVKWDDTAKKSATLGVQPVSESVNLEVGVTHYFALAIHMDEEAGNEYQGGKVEFDINVLATQLNSEADSFGTDYDAYAEFPNGAYLINSIDETVPVDNGTFTYENELGTFKVSGQSTEANVEVTVAPTTNDNAMFAIANASNSTVMSYDIEVTGHTDGSDVTVEMYVGKGLSNIVLYHEGVAMDAADYNYDSLSGVVTFTTDDFSVYSVTYTPLGILPLAQVDIMSEAEIAAIEDMVYVELPSKNMVDCEDKLDVGYKFTAIESAAEAEISPYRFWNADFVVKFNKNVTTDTIAIAGQYASFADIWLAFKAVDIDTADGIDGIPANTEIRLLKDAAGIYINYEELCKTVKVFNCGAMALDEAAAGTTITVELRVYETLAKEESQTNSTNEETGNYEVIGRYNYTFE